MIRCTKCNASNNDEAIYCRLCGNCLQKHNTPTPTPSDSLPPVTHNQYPSGTEMSAAPSPALKPPSPNSFNSSKAQQGTESKNPQADASTDAKHGFKWSVLGFLIPVIGLLLWGFWSGTRRNDSLRALRGALAGFVAWLAIVGLIVTLVPFGAAPSSSPASTSGGSRQSSAASVKDAREELKSTLADLKKGIDEANDVVADASDTDAKTLRDGIDKAQKLYDSATSEMSGIDSADKLSTLSDQVYQENTSLSDSVSAYKTAVKERTTSMTYVVTNDAGYQYQVSIKNLGVSVEKNTSEGAPGTVELSYNTTATATITNVTKDKTAPLVCWGKAFCMDSDELHYGSLVPLYSKNMCGAVSEIEKLSSQYLCGRYSIGGKEYWSWIRNFNLFPSDQLEGLITVSNEDDYKIKSGESVEGWWGTPGYIQNSISEPTLAIVNEEDSDALLETLRQPVGWVVVLPNKANDSTDSGYNGTGSLGTIQMTTGKLWYNPLWKQMRTDGNEDKLSYSLMARTPGI